MIEKVSVVIPTKNRARDVIKCLESISIQTMRPDEVLIVDSGDTEELKSALKQFEKLKIRYIRDIKASLTKAENIGVENSIGEIIIILDDDVTLEKDHIKEIVNVFNIYPKEKIGGVTGNNINLIASKSNKFINRFYNFSMQALSTIFFMTRYGNGKFQLSGMPTIIQYADKITECEFLFGCDMAFRKEVIRELKFDEHLKGYSWGEDDDIAYRVSRKYQSYYTPFARFIHQGSPSNRNNNYSMMKMAIENHYYLFKKNIPQDLKHKFAFWWSVIGLLIREAIIGVRVNDSSGIMGFVSGISTIIIQDKYKR